MNFRWCFCTEDNNHEGTVTYPLQVILSVFWPIAISQAENKSEYKYCTWNCTSPYLGNTDILFHHIWISFTQCHTTFPLQSAKLNTWLDKKLELPSKPHPTSCISNLKQIFEVHRCPGEMFLDTGETCVTESKTVKYTMSTALQTYLWRSANSSSAVWVATTRST